MWFTLGLVSLTAFVSYHLYRKLHWSWGWTDDLGQHLAKGKRYKLDHDENKGNHTFRFGVVCNKSFHFRIKRETAWDRYAKSLRLSVEQTFNDPEFDETFYVVSDNPVLTRELSEVPAFRAVLKALFRDKNLRRLTCEGQHLVAEYRLGSGEGSPGHYQKPTTVHGIVSALHEISDYLALLDDSGATRDPYVWKAAFLVSLASGILFLGLAELVRFGKIQSFDPLLASWPLFRESLLASVVILCAWLILAAAWLRGSSHAHIVMGEILVSGGLGLVMGTYLFARDLNCEWDNAPAQVYFAEVIEKHHHRHRKAPDTYSLSIVHRGIGILPPSVEVTFRDYQRVHEQELVELHIKPGLMGHAWLQQVVAAAPRW
jgi:hypothetical protein